MICRCNQEKIIPGETFTHVWTIPFPGYLVERAYVTYSQSGEVITFVAETFEEAENGSVFRLQFSQEDSLKFTPKVKARATVNILTVTGARTTSEEVKFLVGSQALRREIV